MRDLNSEIREMFYGEYKESYSDCETVPDSYNNETKRIKVILTKEYLDDENVGKIQEELKPIINATLPRAEVRKIMRIGSEQMRKDAVNDKAIKVVELFARFGY